MEKEGGGETNKKKISILLVMQTRDHELIVKRNNIKMENLIMPNTADRDRKDVVCLFHASIKKKVKYLQSFPDEWKTEKKKRREREREFENQNVNRYHKASPSP